MFKFGEPLTLENVLKKVSPLQIFKFYYPSLNIGKVTNSPFREDKTPSFGLFVLKGSGEVLYNDLKGGDTGNWIKFLKKLYSVNYFEMLRMVNRDMSLDLMDYDTTPIKAERVKSIIIDDVDTLTLKYELELHTKKRKWKKHDIKYWNNYGITLDLLGKDTYPISAYWFNDWTSVAVDKYAYGYDFYFDGKIFRRKIYQPFNKIDKWKTNLDRLVIDGIKDIPKKGDLLIITKSRKDRLVLKSLGYNAIATNNESSWIPDCNFDKLSKRYDKIIIFFDNDDAGMENSIKFSEKYNIDNIFIPKYNPEKDIADYRFNYGKLLTKRLLKQLI